MVITSSLLSVEYFEEQYYYTLPLEYPPLLHNIKVPVKRKKD